MVLTQPRAYTAEELAALDCLRLVRVASGKVREYELTAVLSKRRLPGPLPSCVREWINDVMGFNCLIRDESASSDEGSGLDVVYTDPSNRLVMDLLLSDAFPHDRDTRFNIATFSRGISAISVLGPTQRSKKLTFLYDDIKTEGNPLRERAASLLEAEARVASCAELTVCTVGDLAERIRTGKVDWSQDVRGICLENFSYTTLCELSGQEVVLQDFCAEQTFFSGRVDLAGAHFQGNVDFAGAVFETSTVDFSDARFDLQHRGSVSFRNSRVYATTDTETISFDRSVFVNPGPRSELSFEDAVLDTSRMSFSKVDLRGVGLYFFQVVAATCTARFVECRIDQSVDFDDAVFGRLLLLGMDQLTSLRFTFRASKPLERLVIENCVVRDRLDVDSVQYLSLKGSTVDGHIRTPWKKGGRPNFGIIEAIEANQDSREEKSQQFLALKQNFASLGQYDHEDRAFSNFMTQRQTPPATHLILDVLRKIGDYGASPGRLLLTILSVWAFFTAGYSAWSVVQPEAFSFGGAAGIETVLSSALLSASRLMNLGADVVPTLWTSNAVSVAEGTMGWFLLAMFSVAIVRKTVR